MRNKQKEPLLSVYLESVVEPEAWVQAQAFVALGVHNTGVFPFLCSSNGVRTHVTPLFGAAPFCFTVRKWEKCRALSLIGSSQLHLPPLLLVVRYFRIS